MNLVPVMCLATEVDEIMNQRFIKQYVHPQEAGSSPD